MTFGLENKKVALVGMDREIESKLARPYLQRQGIGVIITFPDMVNSEILLQNDASLVHLTHNKEDINIWIENLLIAHKAGLYMLVFQYDMYDTDVQPRITLQEAGVRLRRTANYRSSFHELVDYLKMADFTK